jgi:hypothetical protein
VPVRKHPAFGCVVVAPWIPVTREKELRFAKGTSQLSDPVSHTRSVVDGAKAAMHRWIFLAASRAACTAGSNKPIKTPIITMLALGLTDFFPSLICSNESHDVILRNLIEMD